ncbi:hypothetical protein BT69DRAFT_1291766 [Atractiella rhizophila]|nr:hypothetical protein BT69DRAFT_1291766 [Atractiella rhizophila]
MPRWKKKGPTEAQEVAAQREKDFVEAVNIYWERREEAMRANNPKCVISFRALLRQYSYPTGKGGIVYMNYGTLRLRCQGGLSRTEIHEHQRLLSAGEEDALVCWLRWVGDSGLPLHRRGLNLVVKKIIGRVPGKKWYPSFMKRKKVEIKTFRANPLDPKLAKAFNRTNLNSYFDLIEETMHKHKIRWCDVANMDEKGLQLGGGRKLGKRRVIGAAERKSMKSDRCKTMALPLLPNWDCPSSTHEKCERQGQLGIVGGGIFQR